MKTSLIMILFLTGLAGGILLLWFNDKALPENDAPGTDKLSVPEPGTPRPLFSPGKRRDPGSRDSTTQNSTRKLVTATEQANSADPTYTSAPRLSESAITSLPRAGLPDNEEEPGESVIGGHVQDEYGTPLSNIEVHAQWTGDSSHSFPATELAIESVQPIFTDFAGAFLFSNLENEEYHVSVTPLDGFASAEAMVRTGTLNVNLVLVNLRDIRVYGIVNSTEGEPIEGVYIIAGPDARNTRSVSGGAYELDISRQGKNVTHSILFQHEDFRQNRIQIDPAELDNQTSDLQVNVSMEPLKRLTTVSGRLKDTEGNPVGGKDLHIVTPRMQTMYRAQSDALGNFLFGNVEPEEEYQLLIRPGSGYKNKDINPLVVPKGGLNLDIVLEPGERGELSGLMSDQDGNPVRGFSINLYSTVVTNHSVNVTGDQQGYFFVEDFPIGGALLRTGSYPLMSVQGIRVFAEPKDPVMVVIDTGVHTLQGWVRNSYGEPVPASSITLGWEFRFNYLHNSSVRKTNTDQNGYFVFTGLGPGPHSMQVSAAGYSPAALTVDIGIDPGEITIELKDGTN